MPTSPSSTTTQQFLDIFDITNNVLILKNGTTAILLTVDAMNFGLLAEEEQDAIMYAYAGLLNSLNYPIQIVIQSKTKDVTTYLRKLSDQEEKTSNPIIKKRIAEYRIFVANLIHERNVLDKRFYVSIPASALEMGFMSAQTFVPGKGDFNITDVERSVLLEKATNLLEPKRDHLISQFARIGLYSRQLDTQEIIQLFYTNYNPETTEGQEIAESSSYTSGLVHAEIGGDGDQIAQEQPIGPEIVQAISAATNPSDSDQPLVLPTQQPAGLAQPQSQPDATTESTSVSQPAEASLQNGQDQPISNPQPTIAPQQAPSTPPIDYPQDLQASNHAVTPQVLQAPPLVAANPSTPVPVDQQTTPPPTQTLGSLRSTPVPAQPTSPQLNQVPTNPSEPHIPTQTPIPTASTQPHLTQPSQEQVVWPQPPSAPSVPTTQPQQS